MKCPYGCPGQFDYHDCISDPGCQPEEGDIGMCYHCGGWWEMKKGQAVPTIPDEETMTLVMKEVSASRERARENARLHGRKLR